MKNLITFKKAGQWSAILFGLFVLFHLAVLMGILLFDYAPVEYLWGGIMTTTEELLMFEVISLAAITFCLITVLIRMKMIRLPGLLVASRVTLWIITLLFFLNTVGNLLAQSTFEKFFAIITLLFALLCLRMALEPIKPR